MNGRCLTCRGIGQLNKARRCGTCQQTRVKRANKKWYEANRNDFEKMFFRNIKTHRLTPTNKLHSWIY